MMLHGITEQQRVNSSFSVNKDGTDPLGNDFKTIYFNKNIYLLYHFCLIFVSDSLTDNKSASA